MKKVKAIVLCVLMTLSLCMVPGTTAEAQTVGFKDAQVILKVRRNDYNYSFDSKTMSFDMPKGAKIIKYAFASKNPNVATINQRGVIQARRQGATYVVGLVYYKIGAEVKRSTVYSKVFVVNADRRTLSTYYRVNKIKPYTTATISGNSIDVSWSKANDVDGYAVYRKQGIGAWKLYQVIPSEWQTSFSDSQVLSGETYTYTTLAYAQIGRRYVLSKYANFATAVMQTDNSIADNTTDTLPSTIEVPVDDNNKTDNKPQLKESKLWIEGSTTLKSMKKGTTWSCSGTIKSNNKIIAVSGYIHNTGGKLLYSKDVSPNVMSYNLKGSPIDKALLFDKLSVGTYRYTVYARDEANKCVCVVDNYFSVTAASSNPTASTTKISGATRIPTSLNEGSYWTCNGTVSSNYNLTEVNGYILKFVNGKEQVVYKVYTKPNSKSYTLNNSAIDKGLLFNKLSPGEYYYKITAHDSSGQAIALVNDKFNIVGGSAAYTYKNINYKTVKNASVYKGARYNQKNKNYSATINTYGCGAVSCACVIAIMKNTHTNPSNYYGSNGCKLSDYGEVGSESSSESAVLKKAISLVDSNKPGVLQMKGAKYTHFVAVVGYKASVNKNSPGRRDILVMDPSDGTLKTLSEAMSYNYNANQVLAVRWFNRVY